MIHGYSSKTIRACEFGILKQKYFVVVLACGYKWLQSLPKLQFNCPKALNSLSHKAY